MIVVALGFAALTGLQARASAEAQAPDDATKRRMLRAVTVSQPQLSIDEAMRWIRLGAMDASPVFRQAAMAAITGRAIISGWAGTRGPQLGPEPDGNPSRPLKPIIPPEWINDKRTLRDAFFDLCVSLLETDPEVRVRREAFRTIANLTPSSADAPWDERGVDLLLERYREDPDSQIRRMAVEGLVLIPNDSAPIQAALREALVDRDEAVRQGALRGLERPRPKVSFADTRATLDAALKSSDGGVRWGAVRALNLFGAAAGDHLPQLQDLGATDPDSRVRESALLAIQAIERAISDVR